VSSVNPTTDSLYIPSGLTYSNVYCRLQVVLNDEVLGATYATYARDPNRSYIATARGGDGTYSTTNDLNFTSTSSPSSFWQKIGTTEGLTSIVWHPPSGTYYIHFVGGVENSSDRLRCEWAKISGLSSGSFINGLQG
jgi:hypothetical protein